MKGNNKAKSGSIHVKGISRKVDLLIYEWAKDVWKNEGFHSLEHFLKWIYSDKDKDAFLCEAHAERIKMECIDI